MLSAFCGFELPQCQFNGKKVAFSCTKYISKTAKTFYQQDKFSDTLNVGKQRPA